MSETLTTRDTLRHRPVGAYMPIGQLDGDCSCGRGSWPCPDMSDELEGVVAEEMSLGGDAGTVAHAVVQWLRDAEASR